MADAVIRGYKKLEVFEFEDGSKHDIRINTSNGEFLAVIDGENYEEKDLQALRDKMEEVLKISRGLKFLPVLIISKPWSSSNSPIEFERLFKADMPDGIFTYKKFIGIVPEGEDKWMDEELRLEGEVGSYTYHSTREDDIVIPYDPVKWIALRKIEEKFDELRDKLQEILLGDKRDAFLDHVTKTNILQLGFSDKGDN